ncbi:MAG TPA: YybS family protein [Desulfotomaculum sp.]|nr:YybS family protein [Desulfotomaculum sp.]
MTSLQRRALVEGAFFAALTVIIALIGLYLPPLFFVTVLFTPLPLALAVRRHNLKTGAMAMVVAGLLLFMLAGRPVTVLLLMIQTGPLGLLLGLLFKNRVRAGPGLALAAAAAVLLTLTGFGVAFGLTGINPLVVGPEMRGVMEQVLQWYQERGLVDANAARELRYMMDEGIRLVSILLPANLVVWSLVSVFITYAAAQRLFHRMGYPVAALPPFNRWRYPWYMLWGLILGLGLVIAGDTPGYGGLSTAGKNILYVSGFLYLVQGLSVAAYYYGRWPLSRMVKLLLLAMLVLYWPFVTVALVTLGVLDSIWNIRRIGQKDQEKGGRR